METAGGDTRAAVATTTRESPESETDNKEEEEETPVTVFRLSELGGFSDSEELRRIARSVWVTDEGALGDCMFYALGEAMRWITRTHRLRFSPLELRRAFAARLSVLDTPRLFRLIEAIDDDGELAAGARAPLIREMEKAGVVDNDLSRLSSEAKRAALRRARRFMLRTVARTAEEAIEAELAGDESRAYVVWGNESFLGQIVETDEFVAHRVGVFLLDWHASLIPQLYYACASANDVRWWIGLLNVVQAHWMLVRPPSAAASWADDPRAGAAAWSRRAFRSSSLGQRLLAQDATMANPQ